MFFSAGLGDAVLLIPLVKHLKKKNFQVTGLFNSIHPCDEIFKNTTLLDEIIVCKNKVHQLICSFKRLLVYNKAFINFFSATRINLITAIICSENISINRNIHSLFFKLFSNKIKYIHPIDNIQDAEQNMALFDSHKIFLYDFFIDLKSKRIENIPASFIAVQISAGNNKNTYKNWPVKHWVAFFKLLLEEYPKKKLVLLGDKNAVGLVAEIKKEVGLNINSLVGKTNITDVINIINQSDFFIGLDGGLMHIAVALKKPTFTVWGSSSIILYGYEKFSSLHKCVSQNLSCSPCSAWINANYTKTTGPQYCPDHICLKQLMPQQVFNQFVIYLNSLPQYAA